jgi:hypothetical protein
MYTSPQDLLSRMYGNAAFVTSITPKTFVLNCFINSSVLKSVTHHVSGRRKGRCAVRPYPHSSRSPGHPTPALFTNTSILPHTLAASSTRCLIAPVPESTSSSRRCRFGDCGKSWILRRDRAVAITRSPRSRTSDTKRRPKPVDVPGGSTLLLLSLDLIYLVTGKARV